MRPLLWLSLFFPAVITPAFAAAAIQCVIYLRGVFPEKAFGEGEICGVPIRRLEPGSEFVEAQSFLRFIEEGVLKAIQLDVLSSVEVLFQTQQARKKTSHIHL